VPILAAVEEGEGDGATSNEWFKRIRVLIEYSIHACFMCATLANAHNSIALFKEYLSKNNIFRGNSRPLPRDSSMSYNKCFRYVARIALTSGGWEVI
jgi:hypothetical protein